MQITARLNCKSDTEGGVCRGRGGGAGGRGAIHPRPDMVRPLLWMLGCWERFRPVSCPIYTQRGRANCANSHSLQSSTPQSTNHCPLYN